ncbi:conserved hypothetical protein [Candidatus Denitrolinea symbiosum]|nr:conserved hypothetical protein [Candidatus Denitrolinea symbiosum]
MPRSWRNLLREKLSPNRPGELPAPARTCLVGTGSDLRGDDSAGLAVARELLQNPPRAENLLIVEGGPAPENYANRMRAFRPELVLFIDAAHMDETPGAVRWIPLEMIDGMSASSHSLPLSILAKYLTLELNCEVGVLGIQPEQNELDAGLSLPVRAAADEIKAEIRRVFP